LDLKLYSIKITTWITVLEYILPWVPVTIFVIIKILRSRRVKDFFLKQFPWMWKSEEIDFLVKVDAHPLVEFVRAKNKLSIVFIDRLTVVDTNALLGLMIEGVLYSKEKFYYIHELDLSKTTSIDDGALSIIRDIVSYVVRNNGICLDILLPDLGQKSKFPRLYNALVKIIPEDRADIRVLIKPDANSTRQGILQK
jgi:hypothetical protein